MNIAGLKIPTGGRQTSWLFPNMTQELNWGPPRNNSRLVVKARLEPATSGFQVRRPNHSTHRTRPYCLRCLFLFGSRGPVRKVWDSSPKSIACEGLEESRTGTIHFRASEEKQNGFAGILSLACRTGGLAGPA